MHYGKGKMLRVIQRLQEESDKQGVAILDRFLQTRKLETKVMNNDLGKKYITIVIIINMRV